MCGIAGFSLTENEQLDTLALTDALLTAIEIRGRHATGVAYADHSGDPVHWIKRPVPASTFTRVLPKLDIARARNAILHTRYATLGSPQQNGNNHPILTGDIVGTHNGHISNHWEVFDSLPYKRHAEVDSEAAMALLRQDGHPADMLGELRGRIALAWYNLQQPATIHLARVTDSPLTIAQTRRGSFIYASTTPLLLAACRNAGVDIEWYESVDEYTYMNVKHGRINEYLLVAQPAHATTGGRLW